MEVDRFHCGAMIVGMDATLLVLAGGESRRMGRPKAWLEVGDTTLVEWVLRRLAPEFEEVLVSFAAPEQMETLLPHRVVFDRKPESGPLAGIEAGLQAATNDIVFAIACDMPHVTALLAEQIVRSVGSRDAAIPRIGGRPEPVCAAYRRSSVHVITDALDAGTLKAAEVLASLDVQWLDTLTAESFKSLNTPDDYRRFHAALQQSDN